MGSADSELDGFQFQVPIITFKGDFTVGKRTIVLLPTIYEVSYVHHDTADKVKVCKHWWKFLSRMQWMKRENRLKGMIGRILVSTSEQ